MRVGFFGSYVYMDERWRAVGPGDEPAPREPWLAVTIHDGDIGFVGYGPAGAGSGGAFLGDPPPAYDGSAPADVDREAAGLAEWSARRAATGSPEPRPHDIRASLARDEPAGDAGRRAAGLLRTLGLPVPEDLPV